MSANPSTLDILDAVIADRTNLSGAWIADGVAAYRRPRDVAVQSVQPPIDGRTPAQSLHGQIDAENGHRSASDNDSGGGGNGSKRTANRTKARTTRRTRNATQKVLDYLEDHPSDTSLSTDTLLLKLAKARIKVGRSSVGKALGIARVNGHKTGR